MLASAACLTPLQLMDSKGKSQRKVLAAKVDAVPKAKTEKRVAPKKDGKAAERERMPELIAGTFCP